MQETRIGAVTKALWGLGIAFLLWAHPVFSQVSQPSGSPRFRALAEPKGFSPFPLPLTNELQALLDATTLGSTVLLVAEDLGDFGRYVRGVADVMGTIYDEGGKPAPGIPIILKRLDSQGDYKFSSNNNGVYAYSAIPPGNYIMVVLKNGEIGLGRSLPLKADRVTRVDFFLKEFKAMGIASLVAARTSLAEVYRESPERNIPNPYKWRYEEALALADQGRLVQARDALKTLAQEDGNVVAFRYRLGQMHYALYEYFDAGEQFRKAMELAPEVAAYPALVSHCQLLSYRNFNQAASMAEKAATLDRSVGSAAFYNLGLALTDRGDMLGAEAAFRRATELSDRLSEAFFQLGRALVSTRPNDIKAARDALETFLKLVDASPLSPGAPAEEKKERSEMIDSAKAILGRTAVGR
jgi:tetratricopeptide (TPR) repeat protein